MTQSDRLKVAVIASARAGWATMRQRRERDLPLVEGLDPKFFHLEDFAPGTRTFVKAIGHVSTLWYVAAGRAAARKAYASDFRSFIISTVHDSFCLPRLRGARYFIFGDATPNQLSLLYDRRPLRWPFTKLCARISSLAKDGHIFLCASRWFAEGLKHEYGVPEEQAVVLPFYVDVNRWTPSQCLKPLDASFRVLFIGGDFLRKGGDILLELAKEPRFANVQWEIVTRAEIPSLPQFQIHRLQPDSDELIVLVRSCDLMVLPTRADCSSIVTLEAAAAGIPTIATAVGGIPELIVDGQTGSLVSEPSVAAVGEALRRYVEDRHLSRRQGAAARKFVEQNFTTEHHIEILSETPMPSVILLKWTAWRRN